MDVNDYLIDLSGIDFDAIFKHWQDLLPSRFTVWLVNRFGDMFLIFDDGSINHLNVGAGAVRRVAESKDDFCRLMDEEDNASDWLMIPLVDDLLSSGMVLGKNQCYGFKGLPPILGGAYSVENSAIFDIYVHYNLLGQIATVTKDIPDGTGVRFKIVK